MIFRLRFILAIFIYSTLLHATEFQDRIDLNARLEPIGMIYSGAGQSQDAFDNYWDLMPDSSKPSIYMYYIGLSGLTSNWYFDLEDALLSQYPAFIMPQIGLSMTSDGNPSAHYEDDVAAGLYDTEINNLVQGFQALGIPIFLRIGYEFNGLTWNGYLPESYKAAFRRIVNRIREENIEVATLWNYSIDGAHNFMDYYPGDDYVDWWCLSIFSTWQFSDLTAAAYIDSSQVHGKPLSIGESTPRYVGTTDGESDWNAWFNPYFDLIHDTPNVKMLNYINWNWGDYPQWATWGDCRLEINSFISEHYSAEMDSTQYLHSSSEQVFRSNLNFADSTPPSSITSAVLSDSTMPLTLSWAPSIDEESGIAHYTIQGSNMFVDYDTRPMIQLHDAIAGESETYNISVMDRAGNQSTTPLTVELEVPDRLEKIRDGKFDNHGEGWIFQNYSAVAQASYSIDNTSVLEGENSARLQVNQSTMTNWHVQLQHWMTLHAGMRYVISYQAKASDDKTIEVWLQLNHDPYTGFMVKTIDLTNTAQTFSDTVSIDSDNTAWLSFMVGEMGTGSIWVDSVSVVEMNPTVHVSNQSNSSPKSLGILKLFPNPFNTVSSISFSLKNDGYTEIQILDIRGRLVDQILGDYLHAGKYNFNWDASSFESGVFFFRLVQGEQIIIKRGVLLK